LAAQADGKSSIWKPKIVISSQRLGGFEPVQAVNKHESDSMQSGMCASLHFLPHDHSLLPSNNAPLNFVDHALPRQFRKLGEARFYRHDNPSVIVVAVDVTGV
jgi:hypothetical protein